MGPEKLKKAASLGIELIDEITFLKMLNITKKSSPEQMGFLF
jgi:BRCT domain type II-containing protein